MIEDVTPRRLAEEERDLQARELALQSAELLHQNDELCRVRGELEEQTAALRAREEQLRLYVRHTPLAVAMCDRELRYLAASERWLAESAASDSLVTTGTHFVLGPHAPGRWRQVLERGLAGVAEQCDEEAVVRPDGTLGWMRWAVHPWYAADGSVGGLIAFYEGITRRKHAEMALRDSEERLRVALHGAEAASRAKSDFLARMSHELRTPLNSVIGFADVLRRNQAGNQRPQDVRMLDRVAANGRHLLGLINDILDLSKIEAGRLTPELTPVRCDALVAETVSELEGAAAGKAITLAARVPARVAPVLTDRTRLKQILVNLVGNAVKFTERGGVTVTLVVGDADGRPQRIEVADTGIGIAPERQAQVFGTFEQADPSVTRKYGGTGLGLAISRALCEALGYALELRSELGRGSTFCIVFEPGTAAPASAASAAG
jgi:PAS domain S-box-containing protein